MASGTTCSASRKLLLFISFGYALIAFYETPIPGIGVSFSNLITDQTHHFATVLDARSLEMMFDHLDELWSHFVQPDAWSILANLLYWLMLIVVTLAKVISLAIVAFGLIASAVCALLGPIFVPFFIVPKLDWLFWSWLKAFIQYLVHSRRFVRFFDDFRAVCVQLFNYAPTGDHRGLVPCLWAAVPRCDRHIRRRYFARPLADEFDLLWPGRSEHPAGTASHARLRGESPCGFPMLNNVRSTQRRRVPFTRVFSLCFGVAALIGLGIGVVWVIAGLLNFHVLR